MTYPSFWASRKALFLFVFVIKLLSSYTHVVSNLSPRCHKKQKNHKTISQSNIIHVSTASLTERASEKSGNNKDLMNNCMRRKEDQGCPRNNIDIFSSNISFTMANISPIFLNLVHLHYNLFDSALEAARCRTSHLSRAFLFK